MEARFNNLQGISSRGESLIDAATRETLEETAYGFSAAGAGRHLSVAAARRQDHRRFAAGERGCGAQPRCRDRARATWMTLDEIRASRASSQPAGPAVHRGLPGWIVAYRDLELDGPSAIRPETCSGRVLPRFAAHAATRMPPRWRSVSITVARAGAKISFAEPLIERRW